MTKIQRYVLLMSLIEELSRQGSWCGETHIQKAGYLAKNLVKVPFAYDFLLYKHGPYSFELTNELTAMRADDVLLLRSQPYPYGPTLAPTGLGERMMLEHAKLIERYLPRLRFVAEKFGRKGVSELERMATGYMVTQEMPSESSREERAERLITLKPHISRIEAIGALADVDDMIRSATVAG
jgi:hypothetical protein